VIVKRPVAAVLGRWRAAWLWQPPAELLAAARRRGGRRWAGFPPRPFDLLPPPAEEWAPVLLAAYADAAAFNIEHFGDVCPPVKITVNARLRSVAGRIFPAQRLIELNPHRLRQLPESRPETVFHELIHLWLYTQGLPSGHGPAFRAKMAERGHDHSRYGHEGDVNHLRHAYPGSSRRVVYRCPGCQTEFQVRRRYGRPMLCRRCLHDGRGAHRIVEVGVRYVAPEESC
jgi:predicted SprT family Zn-dependent metalloprotease